MTTAEVYRRTVGLLAPERGLASVLAGAGVILAVIQLAEPILFGRMVDQLSEGSGAFRLIGIWAGFGLFGILAGALVAIAADRLAHRRRLAAMSAAFEHAITLPIAWHAERGTGTVVRTILSGTDALFSIWLAVLREQLTAAVGILLLIPTAIHLDARMAAILGVLALVYLALNLLVIQRTRAGQAIVERHHGSLSGRVGDVIGNVTVVQSYTRLAAEAQAMRGIMDDLLTAQYPVLTWWGLLTILTRASATIAMVLVFAIGAVLAKAGTLSVGEIVSFAGFATLMIGQLDRLSTFASGVFRETPRLVTYFDLVGAPSDTVDRAGAISLVDPKGHIRYETVTYRFPGSDQGVHDLDFVARPGQTIALVGPTGAGKTTALALLQRLRRPDSGRITIDGHDIADLTLTSLRGAIATVFQDAGLFNRSIAENIRIGRPDATDADVEDAARRAEAHDFILRKPGGYGFVIGERGNALSGGERQRLAIARAILKDSPILILDEATSALDGETEARIKRALDALRAGRTTFAIAHRLSTVADADQILVLEGGRIVEAGSFAALRAKGGLFSRLVSAGDFSAPDPSETPAP